MTTTIRRLRILETAFGPSLTPRPNRPLNWAVLTDTDVAFMAGVQDRIQQTGDYSQLTDDDLAEAERILLRAGAE